MYRLYAFICSADDDKKDVGSTYFPYETEWAPCKPVTELCFVYRRMSRVRVVRS